MYEKICENSFMKIVFILLFLIAVVQSSLFGQTAAVCNVTREEKAWVYAPGKDSLTRQEFLKGGKLMMPDVYTVTSFQVLLPHRNEFGFIIKGNNLLTHDYSNFFHRLRKGERVYLQCIQVKDKFGNRAVLPNLNIYIKDTVDIK
jgi:hypothetical protein